MADGACGGAAKLSAILGVDLVVDVRVGLLEGDVFQKAPSQDAAFVAHLKAAEPGGGGPVDGSDVEIVGEADDLKDHRLSQHSVASE